MNELLRWPSFLMVMAILILSGFVHGQWSGRWQPQYELTAAIARVDHVPMMAGDWSAETLTVDDDEFRQAGAMSYWARRYTHAQTKETVLVILMCGRPGRMSVHTPEVCYQGAGFTLTGAAEPLTVNWQEISTECSASFWTAHFRKEGVNSPAPLRLIWGWNSRGSWQALTKPRWETRGEAFLYKMYISVDGTVAEPRWPQNQQPAPPAADLSRAREFLHEFLPTLQKTLFPEREDL